MKDSINIRNGCRFLLVLILLILLIFAGCAQVDAGQNGVQTGTAAPGDTDPSQETTQSAGETEPAPTTPPDGDPGNVTCQGSYTVTEPLTDQQADRPVAVMGEQSLTNGTLQVYYRMEIVRYLAENPGVTFSQPLDTVLCEIDDTAVTWQQYFLQRALNTWFSRQALYLHSVNTPLPTEEAYIPDADKHAAHIDADMPAVNYLYGYVHRSFTPNDLHQAYLDDLPALLDTMAAELGYADGEAMAQEVAGARAADLVQYAWLYNWDYMYYTQLTYDMDPTAEELQAIRLEAVGGDETQLIPAVRDSVTIRQILLVPENADITADGKVTADEEAWNDCLKQAQDLVYIWRNQLNKIKSFPRADNVAEALFAEQAVANSADAGSRLNGGLYSDLRAGQLAEPLNAWCFAAERKTGDVEILRGETGIHILFFVSGADSADDRLREQLRREQGLQLLETAMAEYTVVVDYKAILLREPGVVTGMTDDDLLYPDVAHERYPTAPLYLQQDYPNTRYGQYPIATYGCGITTMSMLASYMTDEEYTPPEMCARYGYYCLERGTNPPMFEEVPAELGFYVVERTWEWEKALEALEQGLVVVSLQKTGYWTRGGHFILLEKIVEDGLIQVRDSNVYNYGKLSGHDIDAHTADVITPKSAWYWIYYPKAVRTVACIRCDDTGFARNGNAMFTEDYYCAKCTAAMERRTEFVELMNIVCN